MTQRKLALIAAATEELGIGRKGDLPWHLPRDLKYFRDVTTKTPKGNSAQNVVIMGRVTWESIPPKYRPLDNRFNIVVSRNPNYDLQTKDPNAILVTSFEEALEKVDATKANPRVFVVGGAQLYSHAIKRADCTDILLTKIKAKIECDAFFPKIDEHVYRQSTHEELEAYVEESVPKGIQTYKDLEYEFTYYKRML